jgi:hypothetical protein
MSSETASSDNIEVSIPKQVIPWKWITIGLIAFLGGGGSVGLSSKLANNKVEKRPEYFVKFAAEQSGQHKSIDVSVGELKETDILFSKRLSKVEKILTKNMAWGEAGKVTDHILNSERRIKKFYQIYELNIQRLEKGKNPCIDVRCSNH